ncbi:MAG: pyruvate kinase [Deltaproteobacteria bacterium]|jgi:pyruvate kinase|nr:pyruvate kinase [Deltaproteobacteria bacterium]
MTETVNLRKTKIVATIGPASRARETLSLMIDAGLNVARLNFSHGDHEGHKAVIKNIRELAAEKGREVGILQDLSGPKIRLGAISERRLETGDKIRLVVGQGDSPDSNVLTVNYEYLTSDVVVGSRILLADGTMELRITGVDSDGVDAEVLTGGTISAHKGVNLPDSNLSVKAFTEKDKSDLICGLESGVDFVAMSFVRHEDDLRPVKEMIKRSSSPPLLIAKIEKPQALGRLKEILDFADGIMVARGDLGVEMALEEVPHIQKKLIQSARRRGRLVITATQMLASMVSSPRPTRAEVTDVANAILDGTDAVMLSDETAAGSFPVESVAMLDRVANATESRIDSDRFLKENTHPSLDPMGASITKAVSILANERSAKCIVAITQGGSTARLISHLRQQTPIVGMTSSRTTYRQLTLSWGVIPALVQPCDSIMLLEQLASEFAVRNKLAAKGDVVFLTCGYPLQTSGTTNLIKLLDIGETC